MRLLFIVDFRTNYQRFSDIRRLSSVTPPLERHLNIIIFSSFLWYARYASPIGQPPSWDRLTYVFDIPPQVAGARLYRSYFQSPILFSASAAKMLPAARWDAAVLLQPMMTRNMPWKLYHKCLFSQAADITRHYHDFCDISLHISLSFLAEADSILFSPWYIFSSLWLRWFRLVYRFRPDFDI